MGGQNVKKRNLRLIGCVGVIFGVLFWVGATLAFSYTSGMYPIPFCLCMYEVHPYAQYSGALLATGIVLTILGLLAIGRAHFEIGTQD